MRLRPLVGEACEYYASGTSRRRWPAYASPRTWWTSGSWPSPESRAGAREPSAGIPEDAPLVAPARSARRERPPGTLRRLRPGRKRRRGRGRPGGLRLRTLFAKPFQALPLVLSGAADALGLTDEELAVACASHNAEEPHLRAVRSILEKAGLSEDDLQNGAHPPLYAPAAMELACRGEEPRPSTATALASTPGCSPCASMKVGRRVVTATPPPLAGVDTRDRGPSLRPRAGRDIARRRWLRRSHFRHAASEPGYRLRQARDLPSPDLAEAANKVSGAMREHPYMVGGTVSTRP